MSKSHRLGRLAFAASLCMLGGLSSLLSSTAAAQDSSSGSVSFSTESGASADASSGEDAYEPGPPWGVEAGMWEIGLFWGLFVPDTKHEFFDAELPGLRFQQLEDVTPELGLRIGYYPWRMVGVEVEGALLPSQTATTGDGVNLFSVRGQLVLLAPTKTIVPFLAVGGGAFGISSEDSVLGSDVDGSLHVGLGAKAYVTEDVALRLDVRDNFGSGLGADQIAQNWEALIGVSIATGRAEPPPPPADSDGDGIADPSDACPNEAGIADADPAKNGCPPPPPDADGDGIVDSLDKCPNEPGIADSDPAKNGCPPPPPDGDGDGVPDASDKCPTVAGDGPDGCLLDTDGDGFMDRDDKCADRPETKNGFEDQDGCPDEIPEAVKRFTGAIQGIAFDTNKATIRPSSFKTLDAAAKVLVEYVAVRVEIAGHTDTSGKLERNIELSRERAESVKAYLVSKGVAADRVETRGVGPVEPVADNKTKEGRAANRRIEFKLLQELNVTPAPAPAAAPPADPNAPASTNPATSGQPAAPVPPAAAPTAPPAALEPMMPAPTPLPAPAPLPAP